MFGGNRFKGSFEKELPSSDLHHEVLRQSVRSVEAQEASVRSVHRSTASAELAEVYFDAVNLAKPDRQDCQAWNSERTGGKVSAEVFYDTGRVVS